MSGGRQQKRVRLGKRLLGSAAVLTAVSTLVRPYRALVLAGARTEVHPDLLAFLESGRPAVYLCWHQDFVASIGYLSRWARTRRMVALASPSRDGGLAAAAALGLGYRDVARGSSREGGAAGLRRLSRLARADVPTSVVVVADGPRPPARHLKPGGLWVARDAGLPLMLVRTSWWPPCELARTWARFHVPRPFADAVVVGEGPIEVPSSLSRDELDRLRADVEARLNALAERGDRAACARFGRPARPEGR